MAAGYCSGPSGRMRSFTSVTLHRLGVHDEAFIKNRIGNPQAPPRPWSASGRHHTEWPDGVQTPPSRSSRPPGAADPQDRQATAPSNTRAGAWSQRPTVRVPTCRYRSRRALSRRSRRAPPESLCTLIVRCRGDWGISSSEFAAMLRNEDVRSFFGGGKLEPNNNVLCTSVQYPNSKMTTTYLGLQEKQSPLTLLQCCSWNQKNAAGRNISKPVSAESTKSILAQTRKPWVTEVRNASSPLVHWQSFTTGLPWSPYYLLPQVFPTWWASDAVVRCSNSLATGKRPKPRSNQHGVAIGPWQTTQIESSMMYKEQLRTDG